MASFSQYLRHHRTRQAREYFYQALAESELTDDATWHPICRSIFEAVQEASDSAERTAPEKFVLARDAIEDTMLADGLVDDMASAERLFEHWAGVARAALRQPYRENPPSRINSDPDKGAPRQKKNGQFYRKPPHPLPAEIEATELTDWVKRLRNPAVDATIEKALNLSNLRTHHLLSPILYGSNQADAVPNAHLLQVRQEELQRRYPGFPTLVDKPLTASERIAAKKYFHAATMQHSTAVTAALLRSWAEQTIRLAAGNMYGACCLHGQNAEEFDGEYSQIVLPVLRKIDEIGEKELGFAGHMLKEDCLEMYWQVNHAVKALFQQKALPPR